MSRLIDLTGKKFGRLTVLERAVNDSAGHSRWICECDCGSQKVITGYRLTDGITKSCGCYHRGGSFNIIHGLSGTRLHGIYFKMMNRCYNPNSDRYEFYGGRGIKVCDKWYKNPKAFCEWSLQNGYSDNLTIDRINNDGDYAPDNCRWVPPSQQNLNRRNTVFVTYNGQKKTIVDWSKELGIPYITLYWRTKHTDWSIDKIMRKK